MSSKNSRVKIHVGRNQKFTSKNSRSKNSRAYLGGPVWACVGGSVLWWCSVSENLCKVTENKRHPQQKNIFAELFFWCIVI